MAIGPSPLRSTEVRLSVFIAVIILQPPFADSVFIFGGKQNPHFSSMTEAEMEAAGGTEEEVEEEFSVWKKNTPLLYDLVICHALEWPSLTVQWLPSPAVDNGSFLTHKLILGTHTSDDFPNYLMVANVHLPRNPASGLEHNLSNPQIPKVC